MMSDSVMDLFKPGHMVKVSAPMVRYSKLPFRMLVRLYDVDLCFTPMIIADSFIKSSAARDVEFSTIPGDKPLIVQFASSNPDEFSLAAEMVAPYSNGVDLNCGCPQRWAMNEGYGSSLLTKPELIRDLVLQVRNKIPFPYTVSVKIRLLRDLRETVDLCRTLEATGVSFITIHSRTPLQQHEPISLDALKLIRENVQLPLIANGDVFNLQGAMKLYQDTGCEGVMAARGILSNPALFAGYQSTPLSCVEEWVKIGRKFPMVFKIFHHHVQFMTEHFFPKPLRLKLSSLKDLNSVISFLETKLSLSFDTPEVNLEHVNPTRLNLNDPSPTPSRKRNQTKTHSEDYMEDLCISFH